MLNNFFLKIKSFFFGIFGIKSKKKKNRLAIILSGGAMNCSYGAGFLLALQEYKIKIPYFIIAASGNSGNATYFLSGQGNFGHDVWTEELSGNKFISFRERTVMNLDYLVDTVFKKKYPLSINKLHNNPVELLVPAICYESGEVEYFSSHDKNLDWYDVLRAAKALPLVYGKKIKIRNKHYFDSPYSSSWQSHVAKARELGATHFLIVDVARGEGNSFFNKAFGHLLKSFYFIDNKNKYIIKNQDLAEMTVNTESNFYIRPKKLMNNLETDKEKIQQMWQSGYDAGFQNIELQTFLENLKK